MGIQYVYDEAGLETAVIVPIEEWDALLKQLQKVQLERDDTEYLLKSPAMKKRLLEARERTGGKSWEEVRDALGL